MHNNLHLTEWLGRRVQVVIDRPLGSRHPDHSFIYRLNYGFVPGTMAPDEEPLDVYVIDVDTPLALCEAEVIAIIRRHDDVEDKLVARIGDSHWTASEIEARTAFQEQWFETTVEVGGSS